MIPGTAIVGPVAVVTFGHDLIGGEWISRGSVNYQPPRDTCDLRYALCVDHHVACDCREATWAEDRSEWRMALRDQREAFDTILAGHPTWQYTDDGDRLVGCMCTGCQIARALHYWPTTLGRAS